nr:hypothetical protein BaRGS_006396 [Batillaria attramentaria]
MMFVVVVMDVANHGSGSAGLGRDFCEDEWRRSHLEIECVRGDGLHFMAPSGSNCNPFLKKGDFKSLTCWAGWEEGEYIFLVAAEQNKPRYCLRFPKLQNGEFSVLIYFSVICPTKHDGNPGHGIEYYELRMRRKDLFMCEDEDRLQCKVVADNGGCSKEKGFVKHCPRSCKVCGGKLEEEKSRVHCWFDPRMLGEWILYDKDRTEDVLVDRDTLSFSLFGDFRCETVISENDYVYKTVSLFKNGCSERYTCFEFKRRNNNVLQYRVGKSLRRDAEADELCNFRSDRYPLLDDYRSFWFKNLILARNLWPSYCGLNSNIPFNGTFSGEVCEGEVGDWDPETCTTRGTIIFRSSTCTSLIMPIEFQCLAYVPASESSMHQFLITRSMDGQNEYNCWILSNYVKGIKWPDRIMYRMPTTQCSTLMEAEIGIIVEAKATLFLDDIQC